MFSLDGQLSDYPWPWNSSWPKRASYQELWCNSTWPIHLPTLLRAVAEGLEGQIVQQRSVYEKRAFNDKAIERLNAHAAKLRNRLDQIYLNKLDGEIDESFYRKYLFKWRKEHAQTPDRIRRHQKGKRKLH